MRGAPPPPAGEGRDGKRRPPPRTAPTPHSSGGRTGGEPGRGSQRRADSGAAQEAAWTDGRTDGRTEEWTCVPSTQPPAQVTAIQCR